MKAGKSLKDVSIELRRQLATKVDLKVPSHLMRYQVCTPEEHRVTISLPTGDATYPINEHARRQLAERLKIPSAYVAQMNASQPRLLETNFNTWLGAGAEERLVRLLDGRVRAVMSEVYRRIDNHDLAEHVLPILFRLPDAQFVSCELTEMRLYLKTISAATSVEIAPGDFIHPGVAISNSEVGAGNVTVQPLVYRSGRETGVIVPDSRLTKRHVGRTLQVDSDGFTVFKDDTLKADDVAFFKKVRDMVEYCVSASMLEVVGEKIRRSLGIPIIGNVVKVVETLAQRYSLNDDEADGVLKRLATGGDLSAFGLVSAVAAYAGDVESYDRATELEELSGTILALPASDMVKLAEVE